jgi:protein phosphatase
MHLKIVKPYIILFGGNTGAVPVNDVWILNVDKAPYNWEKINC